MNIVLLKLFAETDKEAVKYVEQLTKFASNTVLLACYYRKATKDELIAAGKVLEHKEALLDLGPREEYKEGKS